MGRCLRRLRYYFLILLEITIEEWISLLQANSLRTESEGLSGRALRTFDSFFSQRLPVDCISKSSLFLRIINQHLG